MNDLTRQEVDAKLEASEAKIDARLANFEVSIKTGFAEMRTEMAKQSGDMRSEMANIRAEMHRGTADLLKWGAGIAFAAVASTVGLVTYLNKTGDKSQVPSTQAMAPIVIYAQPVPPSVGTPASK